MNRLYKSIGKAAPKSFKALGEHAERRFFNKMVRKFGAKLAKSVVKKVLPIIGAVSFLYILSTEGLGAAIDDAAWPLSLLWD